MDDRWGELKSWLIEQRDQVDGLSDPAWSAYDAAVTRMDELDGPRRESQIGL